MPVQGIHCLPTLSAGLFHLEASSSQLQNDQTSHSLESACGRFWSCGVQECWLRDGWRFVPCGESNVNWGRNEVLHGSNGGGSRSGLGVRQSVVMFSGRTAAGSVHSSRQRKGKRRKFAGNEEEEDEGSGSAEQDVAPVMLGYGARDRQSSATGQDQGLVNGASNEGVETNERSGMQSSLDDTGAASNGDLTSSGAKVEDASAKPVAPAQIVQAPAKKPNKRKEKAKKSAGKATVAVEVPSTSKGSKSRRPEKSATSQKLTGATGQTVEVGSSKADLKKGGAVAVLGSSIIVSESLGRTEDSASTGVLSASVRAGDSAASISEDGLSKHQDTKELPETGGETEGSTNGAIIAPVVETLAETAATVADGVITIAETVTETVSEQVAVMAETVSESASKVLNTVNEAAGAVTEAVEAVLPEAVVETVSTLSDTVSSTVTDIASSVSENVGIAKETVAEGLTGALSTIGESVSGGVDTVAESLSVLGGAVADQVTSTVGGVVEGVGSIGEAVADSLGLEEEDLGDEFEVFTTPGDDGQFRGRAGLYNYRVLQEDSGPLHTIYNAYVLVLKLDPVPFSLCITAAPILLSFFFTLFYLFDLQGISWAGGAAPVTEDSTPGTLIEQTGLPWGWMSTFYVFTFSLSLATGLQPSLEPTTPYTLLLANTNALLAQLLFVFLSGAVFARLSQPARPIKCSKVALICPPVYNSRSRDDTSTSNRVLMMRYALTGPQPCELVDVKVDLAFKYNSRTRTGAHFRSAATLKLVRSEVAYQWTGMVVRHIIDLSSPLWGRSEEAMRKEDAIFTLSVVGLERSSMQTVFHVQHYSVVDNDVIWDAEFEDMIMLSNKNIRVVDHSKLSKYKALGLVV